MMKKAVECGCAQAGKTRGAVRVCLELLAPPFLSREKVGKQTLERLIEKVQYRIVRCRIKCGMTAERVQEIVNSFTVIKQYGLLKKFIHAYCGSNVAFFSRVSEISNAGSNTRLAMVAVTNVKDVSQPNACVPPNELKQKITKPTINTIEV
jgi:hypothetical protein